MTHICDLWQSVQHSSDLFKPDPSQKIQIWCFPEQPWSELSCHISSDFYIIEWLYMDYASEAPTITILPLLVQALHPHTPLFTCVYSFIYLYKGSLFLSLCLLLTLCSDCTTSKLTHRLWHVAFIFPTINPVCCMSRLFLCMRVTSDLYTGLKSDGRHIWIIMWTSHKKNWI